MSAYERALAVRRDLEAQIEALQRQLQEVNLFLHLSDKLEGGAFEEALLGQAVAASPQQKDEQAAPDVRARLVNLMQRAEERTRGLPKGKTVTDAAVSILNRYRRPAPTRQLLQLLTQEGFGGLIAGEDFGKRASRLSVLLSGDDRFEADRSAGWHLREWGNRGSWIDHAALQKRDVKD